jgi:alkaline phosphatase D
MKHTLLWLCLVLCGSGALVAQPNFPSRIVLNPDMAPFYHGVASGDPLSNAVIIWTRVTPTGNETSFSGSWEMATDTSFGTVVQTGSFTTDASRDFTVKVDVAGLSPNTWYYYRFEVDGVKSVIGRTKTAPVGGVSQLRFGVASCSDYENGYFNAFRALGERNDIDAVIHLGDYIYEYYNANRGDRAGYPENEIITLSDYRMRYSQYRLDPDVAFAHQQYPFINVWDDHESANNSWRDGAQNHTPATEGDWETRKKNSVRAYYEWLPIRLTDANDSIRIFRHLPFGDMLDLFMIDSRLYDRDEEASTRDSVLLNDPNRRMIGPVQGEWLYDGLKNSQARWKVMGNQVMFVPFIFRINIPFVVDTTVFNGDGWDGYPLERQRILDTLAANDISNFVVLTGDIHTSWGNDIPSANVPYDNGNGSVGVEFVVTSITSSNGSAFQQLSGIIGLIEGQVRSQVPHIKYYDLVNHGYMVLNLTDQAAQADWYYVSGISSLDYTERFAAAWYTENDSNRLKESTTPTSLLGTPAIPAPPIQRLPSSVAANQLPVMLGSYPNPFNTSMTVQVYLPQPGNVEIVLLDMQGRTVATQHRALEEQGLHQIQLDWQDLAAGQYVLQVRTASGSVSRLVVKQ